MTQPDPFEVEILDAYESGKLKSVASKAELNRLKGAARTTRNCTGSLLRPLGPVRQSPATPEPTSRD